MSNFFRGYHAGAPSPVAGASAPGMTGQGEKRISPSVPRRHANYTAPKTRMHTWRRDRMVSVRDRRCWQPSPRAFAASPQWRSASPRRRNHQPRPNWPDCCMTWENTRSASKPGFKTTSFMATTIGGRVPLALPSYAATPALSRWTVITAELLRGMAMA